MTPLLPHLPGCPLLHHGVGSRCAWCIEQRRKRAERALWIGLSALGLALVVALGQCGCAGATLNLQVKCEWAYTGPHDAAPKYRLERRCDGNPVVVECGDDKPLPTEKCR